MRTEAGMRLIIVNYFSSASTLSAKISVVMRTASITHPDVLILAKDSVRITTCALFAEVYENQCTPPLATAQATRQAKFI